jgi:hypothetical protein
MPWTKISIYYVLAQYIAVSFLSDAYSMQTFPACRSRGAIPECLTLSLAMYLCFYCVEYVNTLCNRLQWPWLCLFFNFAVINLGQEHNSDSFFL